jgi:hypothetical protein
MERLHSIVMVLVLGSMAVVLNALVIFYMWHWIAMKIFDLRWLSFPQAFGIGVIISYMKSRRVLISQDQDKDQLQMFADNIGWSFTNSFFFLALAWIISFFI